jgi:preprotein translocase subunit SecA
MHMQPEEVKRRMYRCDVVYGTTSEFGFDYLRDNMKRTVESQVQRRREFAIVDEVDSTLIDEARTPLIISGPAHDDQPRYELADKLARHLVDRQREWQERDDKVQHCLQRIKGLEGDIRQARDKTEVPEMQKRLAAARAELPALERDRDKHVQYYETHLERKQAHLTHDGVAEAQRAAGIGSFYVGENMDLPHLLEQAIRAHVVYMLDRDYVVMNQPDPMTGRTDPSIVIVDTFTGRPMIGRQWSDGLHQAVECKEKVPIKQETQTVATVTIQNFFKMYKRLAGMTGTADTEAQEFHDIYKLDVVSIPTNKPVVRGDFDDLMFLRAKDKWAAIVDEIKAFHDVGRPVLVGTTSVEKSEMLSKMLTSRHAVKHEVLNAKQHEREAHIIENAGQLGAVMIATNMAGRGTDIKLGRVTREALLDHWLRRGIAPRTVTVESTEEQLREGVYRKIAPKELGETKRDAESMPFPELELALLRHWAEKHTWNSPKQVARMNADELRAALDESGRFLLHRLRWFETIEELGGLHVIGTERHEARRIDNQLRGRSGRQGDNGSSRFYVSLEDDLMKLFAGETQMKILARLGMKEGDSIEHPLLTRSVERAQRKVEERNFESRKNILEYDEVMEHQRQRFYGLRQRVLEGRDVKGLILGYIQEAVRDAADEYLAPEYPRQCVANFAQEKLETEVAPERLKGLEGHEMEKRLREEATAEVRSMVDITLGEYIPAEGSEASVDVDTSGLAQWARTRFGVELDVNSLGENLDRRRIREMLVDAAVARIEATDLSGLYQFLEPSYGPSQLASWYKKKFDIDVTPGEIIAAQEDPATPPAALLVKKVEDLYAKREVEYPVDFAIEMTMMMMRQNPQAALGQLVAWANRRYNLGWTEEKVRATPPVKIREELVAASRQFVESGVLEKELQAALATKNDEELEAHLKSRFSATLPDWMRHFDDDDRPDAVRSRVESILRAELLHFEQTILLETLDGMWREHLHSMDQLRDSIGFRSYSQLDPRIEFKREGAQLFLTSLDTVRDKITDYIFKVKLAPSGMQQAFAPRPVPPPPRPAPSGGMYVAPPGAAAGITGPGIDAPPATAPTDRVKERKR